MGNFILNIVYGLIMWTYATVITFFITMTLGVKGLYEFYKNILEE